MFTVVFHTPEIPGNTGNAIRLAAVTGIDLHLVEPLGFSLDDAKLRRAGLDYHDLAHVTVHPDIEALWLALGPGRRVFAFSTSATTSFANVSYQPGDVFLFGPESVGLPDEVQCAEQVTERVRIPMLPSRRSLNLANSASIAIYEAWRQHGYPGAS
ncbi:tRNA (cytidine(34)-2'-O)-methyltransferase [Saxibacter everestensis]|uniref:Putative tRNA (cytidine(34)-2'-O)-methyltransferase n=1 Tax=Saxibacter everestensis TaxID=2909229 RepID=A0ABY8QZ31_9MICO|nr:tRNA (cytidine(34)-2'-O)-methyltransferase [Brevibacteriaceae bacterium ZFBP1038]